MPKFVFHTTLIQFVLFVIRKKYPITVIRKKYRKSKNMFSFFCDKGKNVEHGVRYPTFKARIVIGTFPYFDDRALVNIFIVRQSGCDEGGGGACEEGEEHGGERVADWTNGPDLRMETEMEWEECGGGASLWSPSGGRGETRTASPTTYHVPASPDLSHHLTGYCDSLLSARNFAHTDKHRSHFFNSMSMCPIPLYFCYNITVNCVVRQASRIRAGL